jgi:hypothetical protein
MRKYEILPQQRIIGRPFCEVCKSQMWLAYIEPDEPGHDRRTFECPTCPNVTVRIVKYRATGTCRFALHMSALAQSRHLLLHRTCLLSGVKRTWL